METLEYAKACIRNKVEHPFHVVVKNLFIHRKARYKGMAKNTAQLFLLFGFANLLLARRWIDNNDSQVASWKQRMREIMQKMTQFRPENAESNPVSKNRAR